MYNGQAELQVLPSERTSQAPPSELMSEADSKQVSDAFRLMSPSPLQALYSLHYLTSSPQ